MAPKTELLEYFRTGNPPKNFHKHSSTGEFYAYCVFCKSHSEGTPGEYSVTLRGLVPEPVSRNDIQMVEKELDCTICESCRDRIDSEPPADIIENIRAFIWEGIYPPNVVEFSLSEQANKYCVFCRVDLEVYSFSDCKVHDLPVGYARNQLESQRIPKPVFICPDCDNEIERARLNGKEIPSQIKEMCCDCRQTHVISDTEFEHRMDHPGKYLCHTCAMERGVAGKPRYFSHTCNDCGRNSNIDILLEENSLGAVQCTVCETTTKHTITTYIQWDGIDICIEVYSLNGEWSYALIESKSVKKEEDQIIFSPSKTWGKSWQATFVGTLKALDIIASQLNLPFDD